LYNILTVLDGDAHLYLQVGDRIMTRKGEVTATPDIKVPVRLASAGDREVVEMLAGMPYDALWGNNNIGYLNRNKPAAPALKP
ncbi:hypothetical protein, partial [Klebsiella michiganensis]|uniref:hypothetical protein n=1 Tax=Klebsiella michiganensis TaxID=1134687 RepID=UPI001BD353ED